MDLFLSFYFLATWEKINTSILIFIFLLFFYSLVSVCAEYAFICKSLGIAAGAEANKAETR